MCRSAESSITSTARTQIVSIVAVCCEYVAYDYEYAKNEISVS